MNCFHHLRPIKAKLLDSGDKERVLVQVVFGEQYHFNKKGKVFHMIFIFSVFIGFDFVGVMYANVRHIL